MVLSYGHQPAHLLMGSLSHSNASTAGSRAPDGGRRNTTGDRRGFQSYRTKPCKYFLEGACPRGDDCSYLHSSQPLLFLRNPFPPTMYHYAGSTQTSSLLDCGVLRSSPYIHPTAIPVPSSTTNLGANIGVDNTILSKAPGNLRKSRGGKMCHYRTKPCRFYRETGRCAKGDRCNFIHEDRSHMAEGETESSNGALDSASESDTTEPEHHEWQGQVGEMSEYSGKEPQQRENYYPITWRVIGGGVMMSGPREICQDYMAGRCHEGMDCKFSHPATGDDSEPIMISELPTNTFYAPLSPLQFMPVPVFVQPPPRRFPRRTVGRPQLRTPNTTHQTVDGNTLQPTEHPQNILRRESPEVVLTPSSQPKEPLQPRIIERPVSTPPYTSATAKMFRVFQAESPQ